MTELIYYMPPSSDSSPGRVASKVWHHLYEARADLELDLLLLSDDPDISGQHPDIAIDTSQMKDHVGDGVFYFPVSPVLGPGIAFRRLRELHRCGARLVSDYHGDLREDMYNHYKNRDLGLFLYTVPSALMAGKVLNWHEYLLLHSRYLENIVRDRYDLRASTVIVPNGIDEEVLDQENDHIDLEGDLTIGFHGRLTYEKGLDLLIQAVASLPDGVRDRVHLHMTGRGPMEGSLRRTASRHHIEDQVHFPGYLPMEEVYALIGSADLMVYPSRFDNFPVSVLEAFGLAEGPVLFSDRMGMIEFTGPALEENMFHLSVDETRKAILNVLDGTMDVEATVEEQRTCARRFTWDKVIREYITFMNGLQ
jgi:glycosyltransferase involved in cell wall biosynthesis